MIARRTRSLPHRPLACGTLLAAAALLAPACSGSADDGGGASGRSSTTAQVTTTVDASGAKPRSTTVYSAGTDGYRSFRIPAVIRNADGDLLAFAEGRKDSSADDGDVDLVLKRSRDGGATWGRLEVVAEDGTNFVGNPAPVLDVETGRVVVLAVHKDGDDNEVEIRTGAGDDTSRAWLLTSDDGGTTWAEPKDLTDQIKQPDWRWYSTGPGHAVQLTSGPHAGRLVVAANHSRSPRGQGDHVAISDDGGDTWRIGGVDTRVGGEVGPDESTAAQMPDGTIVFSSRNQGSARWHRLQTTSIDGGETFAAPYAEQVDLEVPVVQGSLLWAGGAGGRLLFSAPSSVTDRVDLTIRSSEDGGRTWTDGLLLDEGPSGYSDLVELDGGAIGNLHETGEQGPNERIDFTTFGIDRTS